MAVNPYTGFAYGFAAGASLGCWCHPYWGCYGWAHGYGLSYSHINVNSASLYAHWGAAVRSTGTWGYNAYTGREWSEQRAATFNPYTGAYVGKERGTVANPYGAASTASHAAANRSAATVHDTSVYADPKGNVYRTSPTGGYDKYNASSGWQAAKPETSSWEDRESEAQTQGSQRFDSYRSYGGGGWGGGDRRFRR
jgi:hypothetical protein